MRDVVVKLSDKKIKKKIALNDMFAQDLLLLSKTHHIYVCLQLYLKSINEHQIKDPKIRPLLVLLAKIFTLKQLTMDASILYETGFLKSGAKPLIAAAMQKLLTELRPQMIPLVELKTDEIKDMSFMSAIGNKYGDIYERQLELSMESRANQKSRPDFWKSHVKTAMGRPKL